MFTADGGRYKRMLYRRLGTTGLKMSVITVGLGYNFETAADYKKCREIVLTAFNNGINSFDVSGEFGDPRGATEELFGKIIKEDLMPYRDEIIISTKVGGYLADDPMGEGGSRKHIMSQVNKSLKRLGLDYVDILYHENFDIDTNVEETAYALADVVKQGKALYVGVTNYNALETKRIADVLRRLGVPFVGGQNKYSLLTRNVDDEGMLDVYSTYGGGATCYHSLEHGLLTNKYIGGDEGSVPRVSPLDTTNAVTENGITEETRGILTKLNIVAVGRGQTLAQLALAWVLRNPKMASVIIGISSIPQLGEDISVIKKLGFTVDELKKLERAYK